IMIKVLKESISDLEKYIQSVQAAIVRYHAEKLAEVNAIIKEIWCIAYKGTDIDEIKIISHMDKTYSLVMVKNGIEIDMRGRVSAGQKVIASIVIRLALAEAFSVNCGFLTLDEPTTNLDKENIAGLAKALSSIIQARKAEGNFQLLVITHDEDFVRELLSTECTEYFYRLERDTIGTPRIVQLSIYDL
ncbi:DNA repair protein RAD50, partial [Nematocida ausubeli]